MAQPLVGRDRELELLEQLLEETCARNPRFVFVTGEPGIGKTSLLLELVRRAEQRGCLALRGSAAEFERELPFGVVVDTFDEYLQSLDPREFKRLSAEDLGELAGVFPALSSFDPGSDQPTTAAERFRAHRAVRDLIESLAVRQPLVVVLDDLHWADGASLELTAYLLRHPPRGSVMVAASFARRTGRSRADGNHREGDDGCRNRPSDQPWPAYALRREDLDRQCRWRRTRGHLRDQRGQPVLPAPTRPS